MNMEAATTTTEGGQGATTTTQQQQKEEGATSSPGMMKVTVMGPPGSGKTTVLQLLSQHYGLTPIKTGEIVIDHALRLNGTEDSSGLGQKLRDFFYQKKDKTQRPPIELVVPLIAEHVRRAELANPHGWIMERGIREPEHYEAFRNAELLPDRVVVLEVGPETINKRLSSRRIDRTQDRVYSIDELSSPSLRPRDQEVLRRLQKRKHDDPADVARRTRRYRSEGYVVRLLYPPNTVREFDASQPISALLPQITKWLDASYHLQPATHNNTADQP